MNNTIFNIAPDEDIEIKSFLFFDKSCEELTFPSLFPNNKFAYSCIRKIKLSWSKYINQRLLNYTQRFPSNVNYLFFLVKQSNSIVIRRHSGPLNAGMFSNFNESMQNNTKYSKLRLRVLRYEFCERVPSLLVNVSI